jgi:hypothetical protein
MPELDELQILEQQEGLPVAIRRAADLLATGSHLARPAVWEEFFLRKPNPVWTHARQACGLQGTSSTAACLTLVEALLVPAARDIVCRHAGPFAEAVLRGMVRSIQAAAVHRQGLPDAARYQSEAAEAYQQAFAVFGDPGLGSAVVEAVVERLLSQPGAARRSAARVETRILLVDKAGSWAESARLVAERRPGRGGLLPDPMALGLVNLSVDFLASLRAGWELAAGLEPGVGESTVCWWLEDIDKVRRLSGSSVGAAAAAVFRAARAGLRLDPCIAVGATLSPGGAVGRVEGGRAKLRAAWDSGCDRVLFCTAVAEEVCSQVQDPQERQQVVGVATFAEAWGHLTGRVPALEAYAAAERSDILNHLRFRPRLLLGSRPDSPAPGDNLLESLHVPMRVLTKV